MSNISDIDTTIPAGHLRDAQGRLVPEANIKPIDRMRDDLVKELYSKALTVHEAIRALKADVFDSIGAFVEMSVEQYGTKVGGAKGNVSLLSFDGELRVMRAVQEYIQFDERLQAAKALIDACLLEWTEGSRPEVMTLIQDAFRVDAAGKIRTGSILGLRRLDIADERWQRAMKAIGDAVQVVGSKTYIRFHHRDEKGEYQTLSLDIAGV